MVHLTIKKNAGSSFIKQIYEQIRQLIFGGDLQAGEKIPSTREMALHLNVSRNTVIEAYEMLIAEGYLESIPGTGIFVAPGAQLTDRPRVETADYQFSAFATAEIPAATIFFHTGTPAVDLFPRSKWNQVASRAFLEAPAAALGYDAPQGRPELRHVLAGYLKKTRGVRCHPDQILITTGAKQALTLIAKCLLTPEREAWIEDPANSNVRAIFAYHTPAVLPIPVDAEGIRTDRLPPDRKPALIFTTPSHQYPLGGVLSIQRRLELLRFAARTGCYLVEDDYDSEFRYRGLPVGSLQEFDGHRVIYIGTFSKTLFPSLRLGYLVLPEALAPQFREWKRLGDHHTNSLSQLALARFIGDGSLERHIARMRKIYRQRRDKLIQCLTASFPGRVKISGETAGMHLVAEFAGMDFGPDFKARLEQNGVIAATVAEHTMADAESDNQLILGYAHLSPERIEEGVGRIKEVLGS